MLSPAIVRDQQQKLLCELRAGAILSHPFMALVGGGLSTYIYVRH